MMRVLILDDDKDRHSVFRNTLTGCLQTHVTSALEAIRVLSRSDRFDLVCLDFDLNDFGNRRFVPDGGDGGEVAEFIQLHLTRDKYPRHVLVHSVNDTGAEMIARMLKSTGIPVTKRAYSTELMQDLGGLVTHLARKGEVKCPSPKNPNL